MPPASAVKLFALLLSIAAAPDVVVDPDGDTTEEQESQLPPTLILVTGIPGSGKTTLVRSFIEAREKVQPFSVIDGRCSRCVASCWRSRTAPSGSCSLLKSRR